MGLNLGQMKQDQVSLANSGNNNLFRIDFGHSTFRILPPRAEANGIPYYEVTLHFGFTGQDGSNRVYLCSKDKHGGCPICDQVELMKKNNIELRNIDIRGQRRFLYNILVNNEHKVLTAKQSQHEQILNEIVFYSERQNLDITDLQDGCALDVTRQKVSPWCTARVRIDLRGPTAFNVNNLIELDKVYPEFTPDELRQVLTGVDVYGLKYAKNEQQPVANARPVAQSVQAAPVAQSVQAAPVAQPVQAAPVAQPAYYAQPAPVAQSAYYAQPAPVAQPAYYAQPAPVAQPVQAAPVAQPVQAAPVAQPVQAAPVAQPIQQTAAAASEVDELESMLQAEGV